MSLYLFSAHHHFIHGKKIKDIKIHVICDKHTEYNVYIGEMTKNFKIIKIKDTNKKLLQIDNKSFIFNFLKICHFENHNQNRFARLVIKNGFIGFRNSQNISSLLELEFEFLRPL